MESERDALPIISQDLALHRLRLEQHLHSGGGCIVRAGGVSELQQGFREAAKRGVVSGDDHENSAFA